MKSVRIESWNNEVGGRCEAAWISNGRDCGLIIQKVFGTFLARPHGLVHFRVLPDWPFHVTRNVDFLKASPV